MTRRRSKRAKKVAGKGDAATAQQHAAEEVIRLDMGVSEEAGPPKQRKGEAAPAQGKQAGNKTGRNSTWAKNKKLAKEAEKEILRRQRRSQKKLRKKAAEYDRSIDVQLSGKEKEKKLVSTVEKEKRRLKGAAFDAARAEILLTEEAGYLEAEEMERTYKFSQSEIAQHVDESSSKKMFSLKLDKFGPYKHSYTANGRHLLLGGKKGHVAAFDWQKGQLACELHLMETVRDVVWLHNESMFAVAQKRHVYLYNQQGTEINFLAQHIDPLVLDFLPHHFLLASLGNSGFLKYHDVSIGKLVKEHRTRLGPSSVMRQNPYNAVMHLGHKNGTVTLWTPNMKEAVVKMLCHKAPVSALAVKRDGRYMATAGLDGQMKIWDIRNFKDRPVQSYFTPTTATYLDFSHRECLAVSFGSHVQVWKGAHIRKEKSPYMYHHIPSSMIADAHFAPYEDVLGIGHANGFDSILVPGSGEPNYDAREANPFEQKSQRREREVHQLLDKIPSELITLNPDDVLKTDKRSTADKIADITTVSEEKFEPRNRKRGRSSTQRRFLRKQKNITDKRKLELQERLARERHARNEKKNGPKAASALDRFKTGGRK